MEFPDLGNHCSESTCHKLDFLPMKCDACDKIFCSEHFSYAKHLCPSSHQKDVQVPVCPLCGDPVPTARGLSPDQTVSEHIDQYCKSETKKIFTNRCSYKNCKKKELIPVQCSTCKLNFCLRHRFTTDHDCKGPLDTQRTLAAQAAENRQLRPNAIFKNNQVPVNHAETVQGNMSEDEALARALALSIMELDESGNRNRRNQQQQNVPIGVEASTSGNTKDKCLLS